MTPFINLFNFWGHIGRGFGVVFSKVQNCWGLGGQSFIKEGSSNRFFFGLILKKTIMN